MKKKLIIFLGFFISFFAYSQSADVITDILNTKQVTLGQICYLSAVYQGLVSENADCQQAFSVLEKKQQLPKYQYSDMPVPYANLCYIYAQMWNVKGGIMYRLFNAAPRYAFKQLKYDGVIPPDADPNHILSGQEALNVLTLCSIKYSNIKLKIE